MGIINKIVWIFSLYYGRLMKNGKKQQGGHNKCLRKKKAYALKALLSRRHL